MNRQRMLLFAWFAATVFVSYGARHELTRIEQGNLFAWKLPGERPPSKIEIADCRQSANDFKTPATLGVLAAGLIVGVAAYSGVRIQFTALPKILVAVFLMATVADLWTTISFFRSDGIDNELHPAIRLFGYAYGRTIGPILGKTVQAIGVLLIAKATGQFGRWLIALVTCLYAAAALHNSLA